MRVTTKICIVALRKMAEEGVPITSQALVDAIGIQPTELSTSLDIAAGWMSNMRRCGLIRSVRGVKVDGPQRKLQVYELTLWGQRFKAGKKTVLKIAANPRKIR